MIDVSKWDNMSDEQKLQMCNSIKEGVNVNAISKSDWKLMFEFLLDKISKGDCAFCDKVQGKY